MMDAGNASKKRRIRDGAMAKLALFSVLLAAGCAIAGVMVAECASSLDGQMAARIDFMADPKLPFPCPA